MRALLRRQHSVVARRQLLELGFTAREIERRLEAGRLTRLYRGIYLVGPVKPPLADQMAAVLACGDSAYLSHRSAAHLHSLTLYMPTPRTGAAASFDRLLSSPYLSVIQVGR